MKMDWVAMTDYPTRLASLEPGKPGVFVGLPPAFNGALSRAFHAWVKANAHWAWASDHPPGTPTTSIFWTASIRGGLKVVRAPLPGHPHIDPKAPMRVFRPLP